DFLLGGAILATTEEASIIAKREVEERERDMRERANAINLWRSGHRIGVGDPVARPVARYLWGRRVLRAAPAPLTLRAVAGLRHYDRKGTITGAFPAMLGAIQNGAGQLMGVHRTYLAHDGTGKAPVQGNKKVRGD